MNCDNFTSDPASEISCSWLFVPILIFIFTYKNKKITTFQCLIPYKILGRRRKDDPQKKVYFFTSPVEIRSGFWKVDTIMWGSQNWTKQIHINKKQKEDVKHKTCPNQSLLQKLFNWRCESYCKVIKKQWFWIGVDGEMVVMVSSYCLNHGLHNILQIIRLEYY